MYYSMQFFMPTLRTFYKYCLTIQTLAKHKLYIKNRIYQQSNTRPSGTSIVTQFKPRNDDNTKIHKNTLKTTKGNKKLSYRLETGRQQCISL